MRTARRLPAVLLGATLVLTACGTGDSATDDETRDEAADLACAPPEPDPDRPEVGDGVFPVTVEDDDGGVEIESQPERIVSLSPTHTEMLFAIDAGDQVEAVDEYSYYPEEAPVTDLSGYEPSVEAITEYDPDLVVLGSEHVDLAAQLDSVDVPSVLLNAASDLEGTYAQLRLLGDATGQTEAADAEADRVESEITSTVEDVCAELGDTEPLSVYHELDDSLYAATSETFIGQIYSMFGLTNIADDADDGSAGGYPKLSAEYVVEEDADLIFLAYGDENAVEELEQRPAFDTVTAVSDGAVHTLDPDISSRWGPRVVELTEDIGDAVLEQSGA
ncbi:ABC transporter substrate-binding protein [Nocardiopsis kunsanensis]|uniref:ABC transporter substrate-binding protein n=1 Tax=Nocardiopsis kunsanensis TaxID=141693 RepID=A0A918XBQ4_9ACTN|nr:ABC transporter substrate-binding protein [Nocardiopsis kunsanensis]GHD22503.1 ABC transporter substrate-binding protein [Nocardiopsis kunsanensis]